MPAKRGARENPTFLVSFKLSELLRKKVDNGKPMYMIQWQGYCPSQNTWEPCIRILVSVWDAWAKERNSVPLGKRENDDFIVVPEAHLLFTIWDFELCFW